MMSSVTGRTARLFCLLFALSTHCVVRIEKPAWDGEISAVRCMENACGGCTHADALPFKDTSMKASACSLRARPVLPVARMSRPLKASVYSKAFWLAATLLPAEQQQRYHIVRAYRYEVAPDLDRLDASLLRLLEGNANLRTRFFEKNGVLWQSV